MVHQHDSLELKVVSDGDPLPPFLFLLAMEGLNNMLKTSSTNGWLRGFDVARDERESLEVTHLQYADDTLIFLGQKKNNSDI